MSGLTLETRVSYLKSVALTVLSFELLAFNTQTVCLHTDRRTEAQFDKNTPSNIEIEDASYRTMNQCHLLIIAAAITNKPVI